MLFPSIEGVKFKPAKEALAENLEAINRQLSASPVPDSKNAFAKKRKLDQKILYNAMKAKTNPYKVLDRLSDKLGYEPWQLLYSNADPFVLEMLRVYNAADERGREHIQIAVTGVATRSLDKSQEKKA